MNSEEEVIKIGKKLEKMVSKKETQAQALDMLKALKEVKITLEVLQKTRIGMTVNNLRKSSSDEEVISLSKTLIKSWKKLLDSQKEGPSSNKSASSSSTTTINTLNSSTINATNTGIKASGGGGGLAFDNGSKSSTNVSTNNINSSSNNSKPVVNQVVKQQASPASARQTSFPRSTNTTNDVRLKCREMLAQALKADGIPDDVNVDVEELAARIEDAIYNEFKDTNMKYKNRVRSRVANLKDSKNPDLRQNVIRGHIPASKIAVMTADEMASEDMKELRQKFTKEAINDHQMAVTGGTKTDLIKCPKCKKSNCTYNQVQTRSADEPMTTFCLCNECGKRWKFC